MIDIGTNSTRLLVADVEPGRIEPVRRDSRVTRLGRGVDTSGQLATDGIEAVCGAVGDYLKAAEEHDAERTVALATSAVRDAGNGGAFLAELRERFDLGARVIDGLEEARLTYLGATCAGHTGAETLVVDIGGGSTELIVGSGPEPSFHSSLQLGVVRHTERYVKSDPPRTTELEALSEDIGSVLDAELATRPGVFADRALAVAGTPATLAAIELGLDRFESPQVEGHRLSLGGTQKLLSQLASVSLAEREQIVGLDPARAPTIVAGVVILIRTMRAFGLSEVEVCERDILFGAALEA